MTLQCRKAKQTEKRSYKQTGQHWRATVHNTHSSTAESDKKKDYREPDSFWWYYTLYFSFFAIVDSITATDTLWIHNQIAVRYSDIAGHENDSSDSQETVNVIVDHVCVLHVIREVECTHYEWAQQTCNSKYTITVLPWAPLIEYSLALATDPSQLASQVSPPCQLDC